MEKEFLDIFKNDTKEIFFKAGRKNSTACKGYRQIIKRGNLEEDEEKYNDDVIRINTKNIDRIGIDCDKKTGKFRLFFLRKIK